MARDWTVVTELADGSLLRLQLRAAVIDYLVPFDLKKKAALAIKKSVLRPDLMNKVLLCCAM